MYIKKHQGVNMKHNRPSLRVYRSHIYRQYFGMLFSVKPIISKQEEFYAILNSRAYKLFRDIYWATAFFLASTTITRFGFIPLLAAIGLYFIIVILRYFFAKFVKVEESGFISYEMCDEASRSVRPGFSAYLKYIFVHTRNRYMHLIKDTDGREYYRIPRKYYPESFFL